MRRGITKQKFISSGWPSQDYFHALLHLLGVSLQFCHLRYLDDPPVLRIKSNSRLAWTILLLLSFGLELPPFRTRHSRPLVFNRD